MRRRRRFAKFTQYQYEGQFCEELGVCKVEQRSVHLVREHAQIFAVTTSIRKIHLVVPHKCFPSTHPAMLLVIIWHSSFLHSLRVARTPGSK